MNMTAEPTSSEVMSTSHGYELVDPTQRVIIAIFNGLVSLIGIPGNILVMLAVANSKKLRTQTNAFVFNLAVTDLTTCLILPFMIVALLNDVWPLPYFLCTVIGAVVLTGLWGSVVNLALIAFNRYYLITRSRFQYDKFFCRRNIVLMLITAWIIPSAVIIVPPLFGIGGIGFSKRYKVCSTDSTNPFSDFYAMLTSALVQVPSLIVIVTCYVKIYRFITQKSRELLSSNQSGSQFEMSRARPKSVNTAAFRRQVQVTKNLFIVVCSYIVCIMPFSIACLIPPSYPVIPWVSVLLIVNSCVNPIIYGLKHPQFQEAFRQLVACKWSLLKESQKTSQIQTNSSSLA